MADLSDMKNELLERVQTAMDKACEYRNRYFKNILPGHYSSYDCV